MIRVRNKRTYRGPGEYVGRPSPLGNPFSHMQGTKAEFVVDNRDAAVDAYAKYLDNELKNNPGGIVAVDFRLLLALYKKRGELDLVCWCAPERCHADVLKEELEKRVGKNN